jgi:hypothetical protein
MTNFPLTNGGFPMWRHIWVLVSVLGLVSVFGCSSMVKPPKRLGAYLPEPTVHENVDLKSMPSLEGMTGVLVILNDSEFEQSAPELRHETLVNLGDRLQGAIHKQLPFQLETVVYPENLKPNGSADAFIQLAQEYNVPYLLLAVLSSTEREFFARLSLKGSQGEGMRSQGMPGYRAENYARLELALLDGRTGTPLLSTDGQAWAILERLDVPLESNVYPVVRRPLTQPPIYPNSEDKGYETLRWVSGQDAIAQAVMKMRILWRKNQAS